MEWIILIPFIVFVLVAFYFTGRNSKTKNIERALAKLQQDGFVISARAGDSENTMMIFADEVNRNWAIFNVQLLIPTIMPFSDLIDYEIAEDHVDESRWKVKNLSIGGISFSRFDSFSKGRPKKKPDDYCRLFSVFLHINHPEVSQITIPLISSAIRKNSKEYLAVKEMAQQFATVLELIKKPVEL